MVDVRVRNENLPRVTGLLSESPQPVEDLFGRPRQASVDDNDAPRAVVHQIRIHSTDVEHENTRRNFCQPRSHAPFLPRDRNPLSARHSAISESSRAIASSTARLFSMSWALAFSRAAATAASFPSLDAAPRLRAITSRIPAADNPAALSRRA